MTAVVEPPVSSRQQWAREIAAILADLPARQADAVRLTYFRGLSSGEVAATLGVTLGEATRAVWQGMLNVSQRVVSASRPDF